MATGNETVKTLGLWKTVDPRTLTFAGLQAEVGEWSRRNFPNNTPNDPYEGMVEELGELAHARLKARQGIRGTKEEHEAAEKDAIGDIVIYLADYCERTRMDLAAGVVAAFMDTNAGPTFSGLQNYIIKEGYEATDDPTVYFHSLTRSIADASKPGDLLDHPIGDPAYDLGDILGDLAIYCIARGFSLAEIVATTWSMVRQRNWTANSTNGQVST